MDLLPRALRLVTIFQGDQKDKAGNPYLMHLLRVAGQCQTQTEMIVAILHDIVEDAKDVSVEYITRRFGVDIGMAVNYLTRHDNDPYDRYIERLRSNPLARTVKLHDLIDHLRHEDQANLQNMLKRRYRRAYYTLTGHHWDNIKHLPDGPDYGGTLR